MICFIDVKTSLKTCKVFGLLPTPPVHPLNKLAVPKNFVNLIDSSGPIWCIENLKNGKRVKSLYLYYRLLIIPVYRGLQLDKVEIII